MKRALIACAACVIAVSAALHAAQQPPAPEESFTQIPLLAGRSRVLATEFEVLRIDVTNPAVAGASRVTPNEILIDAKGPGITSLIAWGENRRAQYEVVVGAGVAPLQARMQELFPGESIRVSTTDEAIVLSGRVSSSEIESKAVDFATASNSKLKVINLLERPAGDSTQQVMLEVRFAEVERTAMMELGLSLLANRGGYTARTSTEQFPAPIVDNTRSTGSPVVIPPGGFGNVFVFLRRDGLLATIKALQARGAFQSLAEPNLIAYNGQEASFLAGGEFPIPIVQGTSGQVTIQFKEFGVRLNFTPRITGEQVRLKVRPEVSTLDFGNGLTLAGFRVPALKTRRAETEVELADGQSFAIAGLLDNQAFEDRQAIPLLGSLPIVGHLFSSKTTNANRTELLVLITPHLVRPLNPGEVPPLPIDPRPFLDPPPGIGGLLEGGGGLVDAPAAPGAAK